nr:MAG TPA: hypothetical protein [Caudoviricetes sp.]
MRDQATIYLVSISGSVLSFLIFNAYFFLKT